MKIGDKVRLIKNPIHSGIITSMKWINYFEDWQIWVDGIPSQSLLCCWELVED